MRVRLSEGERIGEELTLDRCQAFAHARGDLGDGDLLLLAAEAAGDHHPVGGDVARTELDPHRDALELPLRELVAGPMLIAVIEADPDALLRQVGAQPVRDRQHRGALVVGSVDRHDRDLDRRDRRRQAQARRRRRGP